MCKCNFYLKLPQVYACHIHSCSYVNDDFIPSVNNLFDHSFYHFSITAVCQSAYKLHSFKAHPFKLENVAHTYSINISQSEVIDIQFFGYVQCSMNYNGCFIRVSGPVKNISQAYQCYILMHPERYFQQYNINCPHLMLILKTSSCIYNSCCI